MELSSEIKVIGSIGIKLCDEYGNLKQEILIKNTVTSAGKEHIADRLASSPSQAVMISMAIGTGTPSLTALGSELSRKGLYSRTTSGAVVTYTAIWDIDDRVNGTITEAGIFNASPSGGTMLCSGTISPSIVKGLNDSLIITWTLTIV